MPLVPSRLAEAGLVRTRLVPVGLAGADIEGGVLAYWQRIYNTRTANLIGFWRLNETVGAVAKDISPQANNGIYVGVDLANAIGPDGVFVPLFSGSDCVNIYSPGLAADFSGLEGTIMVWAKIANAGIWTDGTWHTVCTLQVNGNNTIYMQKINVNNDLRWVYIAGGVTKFIDKSPITTTRWMSLGMTWSVMADQVKYFYNGVQEGATATGLGVWAGSLAAASAALFANNNTGGLPWFGWGGLAALWNVALSPTEMAGLVPVRFLS